MHFKSVAIGTLCDQKLEIKVLRNRLKAAKRHTDEANRSVWRMWDIRVIDLLFGCPTKRVGRPPHRHHCSVVGHAASERPKIGTDSLSHAIRNEHPYCKQHKLTLLKILYVQKSLRTDSVQRRSEKTTLHRSCYMCVSRGLWSASPFTFRPSPGCDQRMRLSISAK